MAYSTNVGADLRTLIEAEDWVAARQEIRRRLRAQPSHHWLLTRLALTYYEQRQYGQALKYSQQALAAEPHCPLALWDYAGALDMLGETKEAQVVYRRLLSRGAHRLAYGTCGEGLAWARGLIADCHYRLARCYWKRGRPRLALKSFQKHIALRGPGCHSIYPIAKVRKEMHAVLDQIGGSPDGGN